MIENLEPFELESINSDLWLSPEGQKVAQEISDRNLAKLRVWTGPGPAPSDYVKLRSTSRQPN